MLLHFGMPSAVLHPLTQPIKISVQKAGSQTVRENILSGFIFPNEKCTGRLDDYAVTMDEVEARTRLDFFSLLEDSIENEIEGKVNK